MFLLAASSVAAVSYEPLKLDPQNPHYLNFRGKTTLLVTSGEHYGAVVNLDFNYSKYLSELQRNHLNLTRVFTGNYREINQAHDPVKGGYTIDRNTLAPKPGRFVSPWESVVQTNGAVTFDLRRWNPRYFRRLHDFLREASRRGVVVELNLFCLMYDQSLWEVSPLNSRNNGGETEDVPYTEVYNLQHPRLQAAEDDLVRKLVAETRLYDNLYFEIINEPYWHSVTSQWQRHISALIRESEGNAGPHHLISQNYAQFSDQVKDPDPNVSLFNFHYARPPDSVALNYALNRPIGCNETGFDGTADAAYRIQGWDFLTAGGALYNNLDFSFAAGDETGTFQYADYTPGGGGAAIRRQLGYLAQFFNSFHLAPMSPSPGVIVGGDLGGASVRVLAEAGKQYAIYVHQGRVAKDQKPQYPVDEQTHTVRLLLRLPQRHYSYAWVDPKTGQTLSKGVFAQGAETHELVSPEYREDIALRILDTNKLSEAKQSSDLEAAHFDLIRLIATSHGIHVATAKTVLTQDATPLLVWRLAGAAGWQESHAVTSRVSARPSRIIGIETKLGPVRVKLLFTPLDNGMWKGTGSLFNAGHDTIELARFHYLDGNLSGKTNFIQLQGPDNVPVLRTFGDALSPQRAKLEAMWARANVKWPRLADPVHDAANWALSKDIGIFSQGWRERGWGVGFTGPGTAFGEIGYSTDHSARFFIGVLLDNIVLASGERRELENVLLWHGDWQQGLMTWATESAKELHANFRRVPVGYCSWYQSESKVTPGEIMQAADEFASLPTPPQGRTIQIDDGFQIAPGDWRPNSRFENTWRQTPDKIRRANSLPGLWLAPGAVFSRNPLVLTHPDWFQRLRDGDFAVSFNNWGTTYFLDVDHPDARSFMADVVGKATQDGWGYLKLDFTYPLSTARVAYDRKKTSFESLRSLYKLFREAAGPNVILNASIGEPGRFVVGFADAARLGGDAGANWTSVVNNFRRLFPLWAVNGRLFEADPDVFYQRSVASQLNEEERDLQAGAIGLLGGAMLTSDLPSQWSTVGRKRVLEIWNELGSRSQSSQYGLYQKDGLVRAYRVTYSDRLTPQHRVGLYNWTDEPQDVRVSFAELGFKRAVGIKLMQDPSARDIESDAAGLVSRNQPPHSLRIVSLAGRGSLK